MLFLNWKDLTFLEDDKKFLSDVAEKLTHINKAGKSLVRHLISDADWEGRNDLIRAFQPYEEYKNGEEIFFNDRKIGKIQKVENGYNPLWSSFKIIGVSFGSSTVEFACAVDEATPLEYKEYKSLDDPELQEEVDEIFLKYEDSIRQAILKAVDSGSLDIVRFENQLLSKSSLEKISEDRLSDLKEHLRGCVKEGKIVPKIAEDLLEYAFEDEASGGEKELRIFSLNCALRKDPDFHYLGASRWMLSEEEPQISVKKRPSVPKIRSKIAEQMGIDDTIDYDEVEYDENERLMLEEAGEISEEQDELVDLEKWRSMRKRKEKFPPLTFQQRYKGFLPLTTKIRRVIPPHEGKFPITLFYGVLSDEESFQAIVDFDDNPPTIKTLDDSLYRFFVSQNIQAGNYIYIEHLNSDTDYRIYAKKLDNPKQVKCRLARIEKGKVVYEDIKQPMLYESAEHRFISEIRLEDLDALWKEAEDLGLSIFDCMYYAFPELTKTDPEGKGGVHYLDLFNAVFFKYRRCTLGAVQTELSSRPCFYQDKEDKGSGYWKFDLSKGVQPQRRPGKGIKGRVTSTQLGFQDFKDNIVNYPRPEWVHTLEDLLTIAEHLYVIKDKVNFNEGASVRELDKLLCKTHKNIDYRFVTHSQKFERLLSSPGGNRRQMRLYIQLAHLLGFVNCSKNIRRSNLMITDLVEDIVNSFYDLDAAKQLLIQKFANFKVWSLFVGRLRSSEYYAEVAYRPVCAIIKYLLEKQWATRFELGALFGFVPEGLYTEDDVVAYALDISPQIFEDKNENAQKIRFCRHHDWTNPTPEAVAEEISGSYDPGFIVEELLRIMEVLGILEQQNELWRLTTEISQNKKVQHVLKKRPLNMLEFYSNPDTLTILALLYHLNRKKVFITINELKPLLREESSQAKSLFPLSSAFERTRQLIERNDISFLNDTIQLGQPIAFDMSYDVPGTQWKPIRGTIKNIFDRIKKRRET